MSTRSSVMSVSEAAGPAERDDHTSGAALAGRLQDAFAAGAELLAVELGRRLGLYDAVHQAGAVTACTLSRRAGIAQRYAREWLEQQVVGGFLVVIEETGDAETRRFALTAPGADVLLDTDNPGSPVGFACALAALSTALPAVVEAFRTGEGVPFHTYGAEMRVGLASITGAGPQNSVGEWLAALPDIAARLAAGGVVLDAGCGTGWASVALARAFPEAMVHGIDTDEGSVGEALEDARAAGVVERVRFTTADAATAVGDVPCYDLVCVFHALHRMGDPVRALSAFRSALIEGGAVLVAEERPQDTSGSSADVRRRLLRAMSVLHGLPVSLAQSPRTAHGSVVRAPIVRDWAHRAGFTSVTELGVEHPHWQFYRID
ncbi:class I SAM-dependent methyltransferase [Actinokineospora sp. 24-640]